MKKKPKYEIDFKLTKIQEKHMASLVWLTGDSRAEGKSYLLAVCFFMKACENYGRKIYVFDHMTDAISKRRMLDTISSMVPADLKDYFKFYPNEGAIKYGK